MNYDLTATNTITFNAPVEKVWDALVNPEKIKQYLFGTNAVSDWKEGSDLFFRGEYSGQTYEDKAKIITLQPNKKFEYTYWSAFSKLPDVPENYSHLTFELEGAGDTTTLTYTQTGFANEEGRDHSVKNWESVMEGMEKVVEG